MTLAEQIIDQLLEYYDDEDYDDQVSCPVCGGQGVPLGALGNFMHFSCRQCGMEFSSHDAQQEPPAAPPKANIMPGGSPGPTGDSTSIGFGAGGA